MESTYICELCGERTKFVELENGRQEPEQPTQVFDVEYKFGPLTLYVHCKTNLKLCPTCIRSFRIVHKEQKEIKLKEIEPKKPPHE